MKKKSLFSQVILLVALALGCIVLTVGIALFAGSFHTTLFDFENINLANVVPVLIFGAFISCVVIGISVLFLSRSVFLKVKEYFNKGDDVK